MLHDRITTGDIDIVYLPTTDMIADILTKPLQGELFRKLRKQLLNISPSPLPMQKAARPRITWTQHLPPRGRRLTHTSNIHPGKRIDASGEVTKTTSLPTACGRERWRKGSRSGRLSYRVARLEASELLSGRCRWLRRYYSLTVVYSSSTR